MNAAQLFQMSADLTTIAGLLESRSSTLVTARRTLSQGFATVAGNWTGGHANQLLTAKDDWLDGIAGIETAIADGVAVLEDWAARTYEVAERLQSLTRSIEWLESFADSETPAPVNLSEVGEFRSALSTLESAWPLQCTGFGARLAEPIATLETAAALQALTSGSISTAEYYVTVSYLLQATGLDVSLVDPEGDFDAAALAALEQMRQNPALFTALEALTLGTIEGADNSWDLLDFEMARDHPELVAMMLQQYSAAYDKDWSDSEIEAMVAQLVVFGAVLMTAQSEEYEEFDDEFIDPHVEASLRAMVEMAQSDDGFDVWVNQRHYPDFEDWWYVGDDPAKHARLVREYADYIEDQNTPIVDKMLGPFRDWVFDDRVFYGDDADSAMAALQVAGILPFGKISKALRFLRFGDEAIDVAKAGDEAIETAQDVLHAVDPENAGALVDDAAAIADDAVDDLGQVDDLLTDDLVTDPPRFDPATDPLEELTPDQVALAEEHYIDSGEFVIGPFRPEGGGPSYIEVADQNGASYFDVGDEWNSMTANQQLAANQHALDLAIANNDVVTLSAPRDVIARQHPFTVAEIDYLLANGYEWVDEVTLAPKGS